MNVEDLHRPWGTVQGLGSSTALHWFCGGKEMVVWTLQEEWVRSSAVDVLSARHTRE
jgi:nitrous oxide reductase accessory protein NosL